MAGKPTLTTYTIQSECGAGDNVERVRRWLATIPIPQKGQRKNELHKQSMNLFERIVGLTVEEVFKGSREWVSEFGPWDSEKDQRYQIQRALDHVTGQGKLAEHGTRGDTQPTTTTPTSTGGTGTGELNETHYSFVTHEPPPHHGLVKEFWDKIGGMPANSMWRVARDNSIKRCGFYLPPSVLPEREGGGWIVDQSVPPGFSLETTLTAFDADGNPIERQEAPDRMQEELEEFLREMDAYKSRLEPVLPPVPAPPEPGPVPYSIPIEIPEGFPVLPDEALFGIAGDFVKYVTPYTEADPAALLATFLVQFGNAIGRNPYFRVSGDTHHANLFAVIVGKSSKARKGTSAGCVRELFRGLDIGQPLSGLSSGEGFIAAMSDDESAKKDKRCLITESEFARVLSVFSRRENTLSAILRDAWDTGSFHVATRNDPLTASDCHVSVIAHITEAELETALSKTESMNGFANRFLWIASTKHKHVPESELPPLDALRNCLKPIIATASRIGKMTRDSDASRLWIEVYQLLASEKSGKVEPIVTRSEAQVLRLSMVYALLDGSEVIRVPHLQAALAMWSYAEATATRLFDRLGVHEQRIVEIVSREPGITRTALRNTVSKKITNAEFDPMIVSLESRGFIHREHDGSSERYYPGRPVVSLEATPTPTPTPTTTTGREPTPEPFHATPGNPIDLFALADESPEATTDADASILDDLYTASVGELIDFKNQRGSTVYFDSTRRLYWLTNADDITTPLERAIQCNQDTLAMFV